MTEFTVTKNGQVTCETCKECGIGLGLSQECGTMVQLMGNTDCIPCMNGTFSSDKSQAMCFHCAPECLANEVEAQACYDYQNRVCECKAGFYRRHAKCNHECCLCGDGVFRMTECEMMKDGRVYTLCSYL